MKISQLHALAISLLTLLLTSTAFGQSDVAGAKDHPLLTRFPNTRITDYSKNYNAAVFSVGQNEDGTIKKETLEGNEVFLRYFHNNVDEQPSPLQIIRNYQNAIKAIGGKVIYERLPQDGDGGETTLQVVTEGKEFWIRVEPEIFSSPTQSFVLDVLERAAMQQVISANKLLDELNKNGFIALYINFDTAKWDLKSDGLATVKEIAAMLKASPDLKISIEGHTDNIGTATSNKTLSENRAKSVMDAIIAAGIDATRLNAVGHGQENPIADNRSEEGRSKNRRVELVKK
jgi:outer membrane protein OmpA-like peptidoglycan-associated protein